MGHSMGGGETLSYAARGSPGAKTLSGVIASSPLVGLTNPRSKLVRYVGGKAAVLMPWFSIPVKVEVEGLSHDIAANEAVLKDPLIVSSGTLKGVGEMLAEGDLLMSHHHKTWSKDMPVLILHGTDDPVTSHDTTKKFLDLLPSEVDKKLVSFQGGYHELHHETDGMQERVVNEVTQWIEAHLGSPAAKPPAAPEVVVSPPSTSSTEAAAAEPESPTAPVPEDTATPKL